MGNNQKTRQSRDVPETSCHLIPQSTNCPAKDKSSGESSDNGNTAQWARYPSLGELRKVNAAASKAALHFGHKKPCAFHSRVTLCPLRSAFRFWRRRRPARPIR